MSTVAGKLDLAEVRQYFQLFNRESCSMSSSTHSTDRPFANDGGMARPSSSEEDPYRTLDELMVVVEALCLSWPERGVFADSGKMLL